MGIVPHIGYDVEHQVGILPGSEHIGSINQPMHALMRRNSAAIVRPVSAPDYFGKPFNRGHRGHAF
jgi:hypothetical protein